MTEFDVAVLAMSAVVFTASATAKLRSRAAYREFRAGLRATRLVRERLLSRTAVILVVAETATAAGLAGALVLRITGSPGAFQLAESAFTVAAVLIVVLAAGVAVVIRRGTMARCPCFGSTSARPLGVAHLVRNACLLLPLLAGLACCPLNHDRPALAGSVLAVASGLVVALLLIRWDDLAALLAPIPSAKPVPPATPGRPARQDRTLR